MSRTSSLVLLGLLVILVPFTGFPMIIRALFEALFGACVLGIGLSLRASETKPIPVRQEPPLAV